MSKSISLNKFLWLLLALSLLLSSSGIYLRMSNEQKNNTVVTAIDYQTFARSAYASNRSIDQVLASLKKAGVNNVAVRETNLRDLDKRGDAFITDWAAFHSLVQAYSPPLWEQAQAAIGQKQISPTNLVVISSQTKTTNFLSERLQARFNPEQLVRFSNNGQDYFIINAELEQLDKSKENVSGQVDTQLGFEEEILSKLKKAGFNIILRPSASIGTNRSYLNEYEPLVKEYGVKYLVFGNDRLPGAPRHLESMEKLVEKYQLTVGIIETPTQILYVPQKGLDHLMEATGYPVNRVYSTTNDDFVKSVDERYYRWVRAVVDRGIRILYVAPFKDVRNPEGVNLNDTIETIAHFYQTIQDKGFATSDSLQPLSSAIPGPYHSLALFMSLLLGGLLYLRYLLKIGQRPLLLLLTAGLLLGILLNLLLGLDLSKVYALAAAVLYPTLSSLLLFLYLRHYPQEKLWKQCLLSLAIVLGINALGAYTVVSSLADIRYIMNIRTFSGVKIAFLLPLCLLVLNYLAVFNRTGSIWGDLRAYLEEKPTYLVLFLGLLALGGLYIYVGRSGNTSGIEVSSLEIRLREILEMLFLARPRFKEFIIGYPSLLALVYLYNRYRRDFLVFILGFGVIMGSISMVNSFCHVFTTVMVSLNRTLNGLLIGLIVGLGLVFCLWFAERLFRVTQGRSF